MIAFYRVHHASPVVDGTPYGAVVTNPDGTPAVEAPTYPEARVRWAAYAAALRLPREAADLVVFVPYDPNGNMLHRADAAEAADAADSARKLVGLPAVQELLAVMLAARRLYGTAHNALAGACRAAGAHPDTAEVFVQSIADKAADPFDMATLLQHLAGQALPWLKELVQAAAEVEVAERRAAVAGAEEERLKTPALPTTVLGGGLERGKALVLVGYGPALRYLLAHAYAHRPPGSSAVVLSSLEDPRKFWRGDIVPEGQALAAAGQWRGCVQSRRKFAELTGEVLRPQLKHRPDLLVVEDLGAAAPRSVFAAGEEQKAAAVVGPDPSRCGQALKRLMEWLCASDGMGLLAAVPLPSPNSVLFSTPADLDKWKGLTDHAEVVEVRVYDHVEFPGLHAGQCRLRLVERGWDLTVEVKDLAEADPSPLVVPPGT